MCVVGNLNTVMLAGAGGGFALMNYAWLELNDNTGGTFTSNPTVNTTYYTSNTIVP